MIADNVHPRLIVCLALLCLPGFLMAGPVPLDTACSGVIRVNDPEKLAGDGEQELNTTRSRMDFAQQGQMTNNRIQSVNIWGFPVTADLAEKISEGRDLKLVWVLGEDGEGKALKSTKAYFLTVFNAPPPSAQKGLFQFLYQPHKGAEMGEFTFLEEGTMPGDRMTLKVPNKLVTGARAGDTIYFYFQNTPQQSAMAQWFFLTGNSDGFNPDELPQLIAEDK